MNKLQIHQMIVFFMTFWAYVSLHTSRQAYANAKENMNKNWNFTKHLEGLMDAAFMLAYAMGLYMSGYIGDIVDATKLQSIGLFLTAIVLIIFGMSVPEFSIHTDVYFVLLWTLNGLVQSTGWPTGVKIMGKWFGENHAGFIFGIWSANASCGNIVGAIMVSFVHSNGYGIQWMFYLPAAQLVIVSILLILLVRTQPSDRDINMNDYQTDDTNNAENTNKKNNHYAEVGELNNPINVSSMWNVRPINYDSSTQSSSMLPAPASHDSETNKMVVAHNFNNDDGSDNALLIDPKNKSEGKLEEDRFDLISNKSKAKRLSFTQALRIPNVMSYSFSYACLKSVNYTMFFWLPFFLDKSFSETASDNVSIVYNVGQILGGWVCGWISDYLRRRSVPVFAFLIIAIVPIFMLRIHSSSIAFVGTLCFLAGFFVGGPANMISSAISADLGKHKSIVGNALALATVAGIVDGTGSVGAAICQFVVPYVSDISWDLVFAILAVLLFGSAGMITKLTLYEAKLLRKYGRKTSEQIRKKYGVDAETVLDQESGKCCKCC